jgi:hypothetical protein
VRSPRSNHKARPQKGFVSCRTNGSGSSGRVNSSVDLRVMQASSRLKLTCLCSGIKNQYVEGRKTYQSQSDPDAEMAASLEKELDFQVRVPSPAIKTLQLANHGRERMWMKGFGNGTLEHLPRRRTPSPSGASHYQSKVKADHPYPNGARLVDESRKNRIISSRDYSMLEVIQSTLQGGTQELGVMGHPDSTEVHTGWSHDSRSLRSGRGCIGKRGIWVLNHTHKAIEVEYLGSGESKTTRTGKDDEQIVILGSLMQLGSRCRTERGWR